MASFSEDPTEMSVLDDDVSGIIGEYSIPNLADFTSESLLTKSQYAKVIFHDLLPCYPTDADIWCRYSLTEGIKSHFGDRIALYRVGWVSVHDHVQFEVAPVANDTEEKEFRVLFKAEVLPKDTIEFYQLCYVNVDDAVCGASVPFQFRHPVEGELCEVEEQDLLVVRSTTAISEEKLRDATKMIDELESEKLVHEEKIQALESTKDSLTIKVEQLSSIQQQEAQLRQDVQELENEKAQASANLKQSDKRIQALSTQVDLLTRDNCALNELLKSESHKAMSEELARYRVQIDNMQQMLDALAESKELASQALQCEHSKVIKLNIEHDKYKFRSQQLEEENRSLKVDLQQNQSVVETLEDRLKQNELLLQSKFKENEAIMTKLQQVIKQIGQLQYDLNQTNEQKDCLQLQLKQRDNQIIMLDMEAKDLQKKSDCFEQLNEEYVNLKRQLHGYDGVQAEINSLKQDKAMFQEEILQLEEQVSLLKKCKDQREQLSSKFEVFNASCVALKDLYTCKCATTIQELQDENVSLRYRLQLLSTRETANSSSASTMDQLKSLLCAAEASNASLNRELKQIRELQPDWIVDHQRSSCSQHTDALETSSDCARCTNTCRVPITIRLNPLYQSFRDSRVKLEAELGDITAKHNNFMMRSDSKSKRLAEIEHDMDAAKSLLDLAITKNKQAKDDLVLLNNRMVSIQQQILHDDQKEGRDFYESGDQERLERMSKRCHDLQCCFSETTTEIHDLQQNIQVLDQERASIDEELIQKPWVEKKFAEDKCKILEKLVDVDEKIINLEEEIESFEVPDTDSDKTCDILPAGGQDGSVSIHEDTLNPEELMDRDVNSNTRAVPSCYDLDVSLAREHGFEKIPCPEPVEKAVESGVREGIVHGINALKQEVTEQLNSSSVSSSMESITSVEQKYFLADEECKEQERVLQENLAVALTKTVRNELLTSTQDLDCVREGQMEAGTEAVAGMSEVEADLKLRLEMGAEEYRKLYMQKLKVEKQLAKIQQKQMASASLQTSSVTSTEENNGFVCPICGACFLSTNRDSFTRHYEDHLF